MHRLDFPASPPIPDLDFAVAGGAGQIVALGRKGDNLNDTSMTPDCPHELSVTGPPNPDGPITAAGGDILIIRTKGNCLHPIEVGIEGKLLPPLAEIRFRPSLGSKCQLPAFFKHLLLREKRVTHLAGDDHSAARSSGLKVPTRICLHIGTRSIQNEEAYSC